MAKNCVIITSVISPDLAPLDYTPVRSIYTDNQRFEQTLETIASVRKHIPEADVCLVECSPFTSMVETLSTSVDFFINLYPDDNIRKNPAKGAGEACMLAAVLNQINPESYENFFKLSGRYLINQAFNMSWYTNDKIIIKQTQHYGGDSMHTFFYKFPRKEFQFFKNLFKLASIDSYGQCIERYMLSHMNMSNVLNATFTFGITARWSCYNSIADF
jgi:hypothetical protein